MYPTFVVSNLMFCLQCKISRHNIYHRVTLVSNGFLLRTLLIHEFSVERNSIASWQSAENSFTKHDDHSF